MKTTTFCSKLGVAFILCLTSFYSSIVKAQQQTVQENIEQLNSLAIVYLSNNNGFSMLNSSGDGVLRIRNDDEDETEVYFNLKNDFWFEDIEFVETHDGSLIQLHPKNQLKRIQNDQTTYTSQTLEIDIKVDKKRSAFYHSRILALAEKLGTPLDPARTKKKELPDWEETVAYINDVLQKANGLRVQYDAPQNIVLTSGNRVSLSFKGTSHGFAQRIVHPNVNTVIFLENYYHDIDWSKFTGFEESDEFTISNSEVKFLTLLFKENSLRITGYTNHDSSGTDFEKNYSISGKINLTRKMNLPYSNITGERERLSNAVKHFVNLEKEKQVRDPFAD